MRPLLDTLRATLMGLACLTPCATASAVAANDAASDAQANAAATELDRITVTMRLQQVPAFELPASLSTVSLADTDSNGVNLSDALGGVPGVLARDRQNYAQDTQLSIRGAGARATFGVRGIRLYADGIPGTMPDGQGQISHFNLLAADRVEILRGPFSALYGNSSGGVVQIWSAAPTTAPESTEQASYGRDDSWTLGGRLRGSGGAFGYNVAVQRFATDGYRAHSAARRDSGNALLRLDLRQAGQLDLIANAFHSPQAQDPLGLTAEQLREDPRQTTAVALQYNTRKSIRQNQLGALYTLPLRNGHSLRTLVYGGQRAVTQFLSIPPGAQANPLNSGGVVDLDSTFDGTDLRWSWRGEVAGRRAELNLGTTFERQHQHRRGFENFVGDALGVRGNLRRDSLDDADNFDQYAQGWWQVAPRWSLLLGARHSSVRFHSRDRYVSARNPDDSGSRRYSQTTPVAGLTFAPSEDLRFYLSAGRGFETPTLNELAYRADGGAGLAFDLGAATSRNLELGSKWRGAHGATLEAALFRADTDNEMAVARNVGGRSSYRNVGRGRRQGFELSSSLPLSAQWSFDLAWTWLDAHFRDRFALCDSSGCSTANVAVPAGTRIPGTARNQLGASLNWRNGPWHAAFSAIGAGNVTVNDQGNARAPGYALLDVSTGYHWQLPSGSLSTWLRLDNLLDKRYIGSVIVNEGNGRYYEPAPGRGINVGGRWQWGGDQ